VGSFVGRFACIQGASCFFLLGWDGGGRFFFIFFCSQCLFIKSPIGFHHVLKLFPMFSLCSSNMFPIMPFFYPTCKCCPPLTIDGWKGRNTTLLPFFYFGYFACAVLVTVFGSFSWTNQSTNYGINCTLSPTNPTN